MTTNFRLILLDYSIYINNFDLSIPYTQMSMKQKLHFNFILSALFVMVFAIVNGQTTTDFNPDKYNTIYETESDNLSNGAGSYMFAGNTFQAESDNGRRGLISFDLSSIPTNATITDASLTLFMSRSISGSADVSLHKASSDWGQGSSDAPGQEGAGTTSTEGDASWFCSFSSGATGCDTAWTTTGGDFDSTASATVSVAGIGNYTWNSATLLSDVQGWISSPSTNLGWFLIGDETTTSAKRFDASTGTIPVLQVTYTTLSNEDFTLSNDFSISPNPSSSNIRLVLPSSVENNIKVQVYDVLGKKIYTSSYQVNSKINVSNWASGVYLFKVSFGDSVVTKRFVKS